MHRTFRTAVLTLATTLAFTAFADHDELNFGIYADDGRIVGTVEVDLEERYIDVDLIRGFEGFVRIVVPGADGVNQVFDGAIGPDGLMVIVGTELVDAAVFMARFGDDLPVRVEFEDALDEDDIRDVLGRDDDDFGRDDDDDGDRDDDYGRDDDDDASRGGDDDDDDDDDGDDDDDDDDD